VDRAVDDNWSDTVTGISVIKTFWGRLSAYSRTLLVMTVVVAVLCGILQVDRLTDAEEDPSSAWKIPDGYSVISSVDIGANSIRLWERHHGTAVCVVQEAVDDQGRHKSAASSSCWEATDTDWRYSRGMETFVFAAPRQEGDAVIVTASDGERIGPIPARYGLVMIQDRWLHEPVELRLQALDANGKAIGPASTLRIEAV
jgi:hypothetical protein